MRKILVDTGAFVALFNRNDAYHQRAVRFMKSETAVLLTNWPVLTEVCFFLNTVKKMAFLSFVRHGGVVVHDIPLSELSLIINVFRKYQDRDVDLADASLIWLAENTGVTEIITVDRKDFETYRLSGKRRFSLVL